MRPGNRGSTPRLPPLMRLLRWAGRWCRCRTALFCLGPLIITALPASPCWAQAMRCGGRMVSFDFGQLIGSVRYPSLSPEQQSEFKKRFCDEVIKVEQLFVPPNGDGKTHLGWWQPAPQQPIGYRAAPDTYEAFRGTFDGPYPNLQVSVSDDYKLSQSLVPAALGHRGQMQFPSYEAALNESAIDHELTHVFFPNGNRLLAEGLAIYVQSLINSNPAFPNYGVDLDATVVDFTCYWHLAGVDGLGLVEQLDKVSTPSELLFRIGDQYHTGPLDTYAVAGSFVKFLIETSGWPLFHRLYVLTPLVPFDRDEGSSERWQKTYGADLQTLEHTWATHFASFACSAKRAVGPGPESGRQLLDRPADGE